MAKTQDSKQTPSAGWERSAGKEEENTPWDEQAKESWEAVSLIDEEDEGFSI